MEIIRVRLINSKEGIKGCEDAPVEVLKELRNITSSEGDKIIDVDALNLEEIHVNLDDLEEANHLIYENSKESFEKNFKTLFIGGDHSISYSIVKAFERVEENPLLIVFDSHADCNDPRKEPTREEWLRKVIEEGFDPNKIILISGRNFNKEEKEFLEENKVTLIKMDVLQENIEEVCDLVMERARSSGSFYVSIDISSVDPGFAPAVAYPEPGGLSSRELIYFIKRLAMLDNFRGGDIVEINPSLDFNKITIRLGAKLLAELI